MRKIKCVLGLVMGSASGPEMPKRSLKMEARRRS